MHKFTLGSVLLKTTEKDIRSRLNDIFYFYHEKKDKKHILDDKKYPVFKITKDIFSITLWTKNERGVETRIFFDGSVFLNEFTVHTITIEGESFDKLTVDEFIRVFGILFTGEAKGYIFYELDGFTYRISEEGISDYSELLDELFNEIPIEKQLGLKVLIQNLDSSFSEQKNG